MIHVTLSESVYTIRFLLAKLLAILLIINKPGRLPIENYFECEFFNDDDIVVGFLIVNILSQHILEASMCWDYSRSSCLSIHSKSSHHYPRLTGRYFHILDPQELIRYQNRTFVPLH